MPFGLRTFTTGGGKTFILSLAVGMIFGFSFAYIVFNMKDSTLGALFITDRDVRSRLSGHRHSHNEPDDADSDTMISVGSNNDQHNADDYLVANELKKKVRVLCWVMTAPVNHQKKAIHVKATWGKHCNILLFMSSAADKSLPSIALPVGEGRNNLWGKTKEAFKHIYHKYNGTYDWVLKADDDTFVIVENLRYMLNKYDPNKPIYHGCKFKPYVKQGYMSGGAGYVLSREAVKRFVIEAIPKPQCRQDTQGAEDVEIGRCLELVGVDAGDSRDEVGRGRFFPFGPSHHLIPHTDKNFWYWQYIYYPATDGRNCCSDTAVSFHYISPHEMYIFDYFLYHLRPYGIMHNAGDRVMKKSLIATDLVIKNSTMLTKQESLSQQ